jgi:hypothetical protein
MSEKVPVFDYTKNIVDRFNPFGNDTENHAYRTDYRKIDPQISSGGYEIPQKPTKLEKKNIRKAYNLTSLVVLIHFALSSILSAIVSRIVEGVAIKVVGVDGLSNFFDNSSLSLGVSAIVYMITNISTFLIGCKILNIDIKQVFNKPNVKTSQMLKHITTTWCLQASSIVVIMILALIFLLAFASDLMSSSVVPSSMQNLATNVSVTHYIVFLIYGCIVAPITEEMVFRGVFLKGFSVVSQRFGIFISALFFGLAHGNVLQGLNAFILGLYLAYVATKYNSILPNILMHICANSVPYLTILLSSKSLYLCGIIMCIFYSTAMILGIVFLCLGIHKKSNRLPVQTRSQRSRTLPILMTSIGFIVTFALYVFNMVYSIFAS